MSLVRDAPRPYGERGTNSQARVSELLDLLGNPHHGLVCIHIAGSKGKGSTALFVDAVLRRLGYRTGVFMSPHLEDWTERFIIDGRPVEASALDSVVSSLAPAVRRVQSDHPQSPPTFFDALTATAFSLFKNFDVQYAVVETGLGGRYDATRVCEAGVCCITTIELEHTDKLGTTLDAIATHKAGIIRTGVPLVTGSLAPAAREVVTAEAGRLRAPLQPSGDSFQTRVERRGLQTRLHFHATDFDLEVDLQTPSRAVASNAGLAVQCARTLLGSEVDQRAGDVALALSRAVLPGRSEILSEQPLVMIDAAHTDTSLKYLTNLLVEIKPSRCWLVLSVSHGKQLDAALASLVQQATAVTATVAESNRSVSATDLQTRLQTLAPQVPVRLEPDPAVALRRAYASMQPTDMLCATGSVYMAGAARRVLRDLLCLSAINATASSDRRHWR